VARLQGLLARTTRCEVFSGIVLGTFPVVEVVDGPASRRLTLGLDASTVSGLQLGASVALDGTCLTAVTIDSPRVSFDVIDETLAKTTLGDLRVGSLVNVERSLRVGDEIGGHHVSGHVTGTAEIATHRERGENLAVEIAMPAAWAQYVLPKGFVAVDGCSLTVGETSQNGFWLHLIPETRRRTTLGFKRVGDRVNVELDSSTVAIVETVRRVLDARFAAEDSR